MRWLPRLLLYGALIGAVLGALAMRDGDGVTGDTVLHGTTSQQKAVQIALDGDRVVALELDIDGHCGDAVWETWWYPEDGLPVNFEQAGSEFTVTEAKDDLEDDSVSGSGSAEWTLRGRLGANGESAEGSARVVGLFTYTDGSRGRRCDSGEVRWSVRK